MKSKMIAGLWVATLVSALGVVHVSHSCRLLYSELAQLQQEENDLQVAWGQYLLEQSSLATLTLIESKAEQELGMRVPELQDVVMVQP
jgi:cell division protein FtsL